MGAETIWGGHRAGHQERQEGELWAVRKTEARGHRGHHRKGLAPKMGLISDVYKSPVQSF